MCVKAGRKREVQLLYIREESSKKMSCHLAIQREKQAMGAAIWIKGK